MNSIHPVIVNFAIILLGTGIAAEILGLLLKAAKIKRVAGYLIWSGGFCALTAVLSGNDAFFHLNDPELVAGVVDNHKLFGQLTLWSTILTLVVRQLIPRDNRWFNSVFAILLIITGALLFQTATLGGEMEHRLHPEIEKPSEIKKPSFQ